MSLREDSITLEVDLRYEDYDQAVAESQRIQTERLQREQRRKSGRLILPYMIGAGLLMLLLLHFMPRLDSYSDIRPPGYLLIMTVVPLVVFSIAAGLLAAAHGGRGPLASILAWLIVTGIAIFMIMRLQVFEGTPDWFGTVFPHVMWILFGAWLYGRWIVMMARQQRQNAWEFQPDLLRRRKVRIAEEGLSVDERVAQRRYDWVCFTRFSETRDTLLLWLSDVSFEILPKRCFVSETDLDRARQFLRLHIRDVDQQPPAFPVLPAATSRPPHDPGPSDDRIKA